VNPTPETIASAVVLFATMAAYAVLSGADFGAGVWDLLAGGSRQGQRPRATIRASVAPVWEGNHVWIIFGMVVAWTAFPPAFSAIMTTLFVPLFLSLLGIFFRGIGFAFLHEARQPPTRRLLSVTFAGSSLIAPFFLGTVIGAVATGRVPAHPAGNGLSAWTNPTALLTGALFVCACAYIGGVYLVGDAERRGEADMVHYFSRRALGAGLATGVLAAVNMYVLRTDSPYVFGGLVGRALPLVALSVAAGVAALGLILLRRYVLLRVTAALAVMSVIGGWGWAQYPWLLPGTLTLADGSASGSALWALLAVVALAVVLVVPSFVYLYWLQQHEQLAETEAVGDLRERIAAAQTRPAPSGPADRRPPPDRRVLAIVAASSAVSWIRDLFKRDR
jgi:cytochrome d ubiquinol oxidase subunit II